MPRSKSKQDTPESAAETDDVSMQEAPISHQPSGGSVAGSEAEDASMADVEPVAESEAGGEEEDEDDEEDDEPIKVKLLPGSTPTAASFEFHDEGHTLGNALRYVIMKNPDVEFCAYAIPHPSEPKMNVRIQTYEKSGTTAFQALEKGLRDIQELCDVVEDKFVAAREDFKARMSD